MEQQNLQSPVASSNDVDTVEQYSDTHTQIGEIAETLSSISFSSEQQQSSSTNTTNDEQNDDDESSSTLTTTTQRYHPAATYLHSLPQQQQAIPSQILEDAKILICDDERATLTIARRLLERSGYKKVYTVSNGMEALESLKKEGPFDLVLSDIYMPGGMNGHELIQEIRRLSKSLPIIMMSSSDEFNTVRECLFLGADHYILKPLRAEELKGIWQVILRRRREMEVVQMLENEKRKSQKLQLANNRLNSEINRLKHEKNHAVHESVSILIGNLNEIQLKRHRSLPSGGEQQPTSTEFSVAEEVILNILRQFDQSLTFHESLLEHLSEGSPIAPATKALLRDRLSANSDEIIQRLAPAVTEHWPTTNITDSQLSGWEFSVFQVCEDELLPAIESMYDGLGLIDAFDLPRDKFRNFLWEVRSHYCPSNPYHNFLHAFDVAQSVYTILRSGNGQRVLTNIEMLAILTAALIHDIDHQGLNNVYQTSTWSQLAIRYNDRSVMENHHCSLGFFLLMKPQNYFLSHLNVEDKNRFRQIVVNSVLATDMAQHSDILTKADQAWNGDVSSSSSSSGPLSFSLSTRTLLCQLILKSADVGNPAKPWDQVMRWALCVQMEFYNQGDQEKALGLPVASFMMRPEGKGLEGLTPASLAKGQVMFIETVVQPLFSVLVRFLPKCSPRVDLLNSSLAQWKFLSISSLPSLGDFSSKLSATLPNGEQTLAIKAPLNHITTNSSVAVESPVQ